MVPNTPNTANSLFSPSEENLRHKCTGWGRTKLAAANRFCLFQITYSLFIVDVERAAMKALSGIPNTLILNILDKSNMLSIRSYSCSMINLLPLYCYFILNMFYELRPKFPTVFMCSLVGACQHGVLVTSASNVCDWHNFIV